MKRIKNLYEEISSLDNCIQAAIECVRGKRKRNQPGTAVFEIASNPVYYGHKVHEMLASKQFVPSPPHHFKIKDGLSKKVREIDAPELFPDQIVHWAIMRVLGPILMNRFYPYSCGSIPGKGTGGAKKYIEKKLEIDTKNHKHVRSNYKYCLKLDIRHYFPSINRQILINKLCNIIKDRDLINLFSMIIYSIPGDKGLPIGYYTSQWLSNFYLNDFDQWLKKRLSEIFDKSIYVRYVDDLVIIGPNKRKLRRLKEEINDYINTNLNVEIKEQDYIFDIGKCYLDFVGFKFTYGKTIARNRIFKESIRKEKELQYCEYIPNKLACIISRNTWMNIHQVRKTTKKIYSHTVKFYIDKYKSLTKKSKYRIKWNRAVNRGIRRQAMINKELEYYQKFGKIIRIDRFGKITDNIDLCV